MNFANDKIEIVSIIESVFEKPNIDYKICLNRFTLKINDNFLDNRGKYLKEEISFFRLKFKKCISIII